MQFGEEKVHFLLMVPDHNLSLRESSKNLKPGLLAILYKIATSERMQFTAKKMEQGQRKM